MSIGLEDFKIRTTDDIDTVKHRLSDTPAYSDSRSRDGAHVRELTDYFCRASARIGELRRVRSR